MSKKKPMTMRQRKERAEIKKDLMQRGILPPPKKPLNRKAFIKDAEQDGKEMLGAYSDARYFWEALTMVIGWHSHRPTLEAVGAAKVMKIACEIKRFEREKADDGDTHYKLKDLFERVQPILEK